MENNYNSFIFRLIYYKVIVQILVVDAEPLRTISFRGEHGQGSPFYPCGLNVVHCQHFFDFHSQIVGQLALLDIVRNVLDGYR